MNLQAVFERKPAGFGLRKFEVVKTIQLSADMFQCVLEKPGRETNRNLRRNPADEAVKQERIGRTQVMDRISRMWGPCQPCEGL